MTKLGHVAPGVFPPICSPFTCQPLCYTLHLLDITLNMIFESLIVYRLYSSRTLCHIKEKPFIVKNEYAYTFPLHKKENLGTKKTLQIMWP